MISGALFNIWMVVLLSSLALFLVWAAKKILDIKKGLKGNKYMKLQCKIDEGLNRLRKGGVNSFPPNDVTVPLPPPPQRRPKSKS